MTKGQNGELPGSVQEKMKKNFEKQKENFTKAKKLTPISSSGDHESNRPITAQELMKILDARGGNFCHV